MEIIQNNNKHHHCRKNGYFTAIFLIVLGLLFLGKNLGFIQPDVFRIIVSWQMLLIILGLWSIVRRHYFGGVVLIGVGTFFLMPQLTCAGTNWESTYWPLMLILLGILILARRKRKKTISFHTFNDVSHQSENGFLNSENVFGGVRHIILDPVFKGGVVRNTFGGTVIDLRRTTLEAEQTFIDVDCSFGGIEIFAPNHWLIVSELKPVVGGFNDKRYQAGETIDHAHKLIIRGTLTFSGVEVKS